MAKSVEALKACLERVPEVLVAYLFGSQVTGETGPMSDYDLGIWGQSSASSSSLRHRLSREAAHILETEQVDVVFF